MLLNALGVGRMQLLAVVSMLALNLPLTLLLVHPIGPAGPVLATVGSTALCITVPSLRRALKSGSATP
jgi:O-antigen/teichoic acid export membrane protein